jgi:hypothetical protein
MKINELEIISPFKSDETEDLIADQWEEAKGSAEYLGSLSFYSVYGYEGGNRSKFFIIDYGGPVGFSHCPKNMTITICQ